MRCFLTDKVYSIRNEDLLNFFKLANENEGFAEWHARVDYV